MVRIHDEGADGLQDECKEECEKHRSTPPAVRASHGVGADAAEADAAAAASCTAGADAATAAFSRSAGSTEVVRVPEKAVISQFLTDPPARLRSRAQEGRAKLRCRFFGVRCCLAKQACQCGEFQ